MPSITAFTESEIQEHLKPLPDWKIDGNAIMCTTTFPSFLRAIEFVNALAHLAERQDHHPDIIIQYHRVTIRYRTHTAKGVTALDFEGANEAEGLISIFKKEPVPAY